MFGIRTPEDTQYHIAIISKTGAGKSNVLRSLIINDLQNGRGCAVIDNHSSLINSIREYIPNDRRDDVVDMDIPNPNLKLGYNPIKKVSESKRSLVASGILEIFERSVESNAWGAKLSYILFNCIMAVMELPRQATFSDILRILQDKAFRKECISHIKNEEVCDFFTKQFGQYNPKFDFTPIYKLFRFLAHPPLKRLLVENTDSVSLRDIIDHSKILLVNNAKGEIGSDASTLIGNMLINSLSLAAFTRTTISEEDRVPFTIYIDEAQNYASSSSSSITTMLEELRKMKIQVCLAFQSLSSIDQTVRDSIFANVGNLLLMRTSAKDGQFLAHEMAKYHQPFTYEDFVLMPRYHMIARIMISGQPCIPFTCVTIVYDDYF